MLHVDAHVRREFQFVTIVAANRRDEVLQTVTITTSANATQEFSLTATALVKPSRSIAPWGNKGAVPRLPTGGQGVRSPISLAPDPNPRVHSPGPKHTHNDSFIEPSPRSDCADGDLEGVFQRQRSMERSTYLKPFSDSIIRYLQSTGQGNQHAK